MEYELKTGVVIVAGGSGRRCGGAIPKQFKLLGGMPVLAHTINRMAEALPGARIVVVLPAPLQGFWRDLSARFEVARHTVVEGGAERFDSVKQGLAALAGDERLIAVQDGVRPMITRSLIRRVAAAAAEFGAAIPVVEAIDSYRDVDVEGQSRIIDRSKLRIVQTPQIFRGEVLRAAYERPYEPTFTDDASVVEAAGGTIRLVAGERENLKITTSEDFAICEALLAARENESDADHL